MKSGKFKIIFLFTVFAITFTCQSVEIREDKKTSAHNLGNMKITVADKIRETTVVKKKVSKKISKKKEIDNKEEDLTEKYKNLITSKIVTSVPWEDDENFKKAQQKNGTEVLLAAYCAILNDPLPGEEENVHIGARLLCGTVIEPNKVFSQNKTIGPYDLSKGYKKGPTYIGTKITTTIGGGVCKIASTLYNVAVMSNLPIIERHEHGMPVSYVPYGQDATVYYGAKDFKFKNNTGAPLLIWTRGIGNELYIGFYGKNKPPKVQWHHEYLSIKRSETIYKINKTLKPDENRTVVIGMDGAVLKSWVTIESPDGTIINKNLGGSSYIPLPTVVEKGS